MIPHISKYLEIYTLYLSRQATKISVLYGKDFKQYLHSIHRAYGHGYRRL